MTNFISKIFGILADFKFPKFIQNYLNSWYVRHFKINMSEFKNPSEYKSLNELFTRTLQIPREICKDKSAFLSPSDGQIYAFGIADKFSAISVKGAFYDTKTLLDDFFCDQENLFYINIYLSPKDYHHYHAPCDMQILSALYIPGELKSVAKSVLLKNRNLYSTNERVILKCNANENIFYMIFVGALNVGRMKFDFDQTIKTNAKFGKNLYKYENLFITKGEHLGNFELGSTILILCEKDFLNYSKLSQKDIKFGEILANFKI